MLCHAQVPEPREQVGTADGAQHRPPNWPLLLDWAGLWEVLRILHTLKSQKKSGFGIFVVITGWIQPLLGICTQQSSPKAVCVVLLLAEGSPPSARSFSPPPERFFPPANSSPGEETLDPSHLLHIWPGCYPPYLLKGSVVPQAVCCRWKWMIV